MKLVYKQIEDLAAVDTTVLITGETGTGKELAARAIHYSSSRKSKPFIAVNCAGLTESLLASQLFGHRRGAFTGAVADQVGLVEAAEGGTLFLDEIGDIPGSVQTSLLKGVAGEGDHTAGRVEAAAGKSAHHRGDSPGFESSRCRRKLSRRPLLPHLYRKDRAPAVTSTADDLPLLGVVYGTDAHTAGKKVQEFSRDAMEALLEYQWPGNVRELEKRGGVGTRSLPGTSSSRGPSRDPAKWRQRRKPVNTGASARERKPGRGRPGCSGSAGPLSTGDWPPFRTHVVKTSRLDLKRHSRPVGRLLTRILGS